jgi:hypothetical protein
LRNLPKDYGMLNYDKLVADGILVTEKYGWGGVVPLAKSKIRDSMLERTIELG